MNRRNINDLNKNFFFLFFPSVVFNKNIFIQFDKKMEKKEKK